MAFRFRLARVLQIRERGLQAEEAKFESLLAKRAWYQERQEELRRSMEQATRKVKEQATLSHLDLPALAHFVRQAGQQQISVRNEAAEHEKAIASQWAAVIEARRALMLLQKLRETQRAQWQEAEDGAEEVRASDFVAAQRSRDAIQKKGLGKNPSSLEIPTTC